MAQLTPQTDKQSYINNPFMIAAEGIKLLFTKAMGIAILLTILSSAGGLNLTSPGSAEQAASDQGNVGTVSAAVIVAIVLFALVAMVAFIFIGTIINGITAYGTAKLSRGEEASLKEAWHATIQQFWGLIWLQVVLGFKLLGWTLLFIVPGIIMYYRYSLAMVAFFDKDLRGNAAIKESLALTKGSWLTTFSSQIIFNLVTLGGLSMLSKAGATAVLFRQFQTTPLENRPKAHGLAIATLVISIAILIALIAFGALAAYLAANNISTL